MNHLDLALEELATTDLRTLDDGALGSRLLGLVRRLELLESHYVRLAHELARRRRAAA